MPEASSLLPVGRSCQNYDCGLRDLLQLLADMAESINSSVIEPD